MSGKRYQVFMAPSAHRKYKKFDPLLKEKIKEEIKHLSESPLSLVNSTGIIRPLQHIIHTSWKGETDSLYL